MRMGRRRSIIRSMATDPVTRLCRLELIAGREHACPREACSFWEPGGAVLDGRCMFERVDIAAWPELAADLIDIRDRLDAGAGDASAG
jgi:hypothetical protein